MRITPLAEDLRRCLDLRASGEVDDDGRFSMAAAPDPAGASDAELVSFGRLSQLDVRQALTLVLKRQWERYVAVRAEKERDGNVGASPSAAAGGPGACRHLSREFHPGADGSATAEELFALFEEQEHYASRSGYDARSFQALAHHCILLNLHLLSIHGPEMEAFAASQSAERSLLRVAPAALSDAYWLKQRLWREMEDEVGSLLLALEARALENQRLQQQWMETFGPSYLPLVELECRFASLERMIRRKGEYPDLGLQKLEKLEGEHLRREEQEAARLRCLLARAKAGPLPGAGGMPLEGAEVLAYEEDSRKLLREIYRLTHPDVVGHRCFTEAQKERLADCYREAVAFADAAALDDVEIALGMRSLPSLQSILVRARRIWECMGLDVNEASVIRGDTLAERMEWLDAKIAELEEEAKGVRADLLAAATDPDVREKRASMASEALIAQVNRGLAEKREWYEAQIPGLDARLRQLCGQPEQA
ncbi:MAG: hypothetical protein HZB55_21795 [Deltaproteobacteria bacterium]|nr:hypothetical protein [Deltaproteobacteria bacterium]